MVFLMIHIMTISNSSFAFANVIAADGNDFLGSILPLLLLLFAFGFLIPAILFLQDKEKRATFFKGRGRAQVQQPWFKTFSLMVALLLFVWFLFTSAAYAFSTSSASPVASPTPKVSPTPPKKSPTPTPPKETSTVASPTPTAVVCQSPTAVKPATVVACQVQNVSVPPQAHFP